VVKIENLILWLCEAFQGAKVVPGVIFLVVDSCVSFGCLQNSHSASAVDGRIAVGEEGNVVLCLPAEAVQPNQ
jgi:hypothetical protein